MGKPPSDAQREALWRLARYWALGQPQSWDAIRPQTRDALWRAGLADHGGITPWGLGLTGLRFTGPALGAWGAAMQKAARAEQRRRAYLQTWWAQVPLSHPAGGALPLLAAADLRAAAGALAPLEAARVEAQLEAERLLGPARAEVRAAMGLEVPAGGSP